MSVQDQIKIVALIKGIALCNCFAMFALHFGALINVNDKQYLFWIICNEKKDISHITYHNNRRQWFICLCSVAYSESEPDL